MKLWQKNMVSLAEVEAFTVGKDRDFDLLLAPFDVLGNMAHARMLAEVGLLTQPEALALHTELKHIYEKIQHPPGAGEADSFRIQDGVEDIHSQIELLLTEKLGDTGKKIHAARSRNDQILLDIKLFLRTEIEKTPPGICCRLWIFLSDQPGTYHRIARIFGSELQCGLCTNGTRESRKDCCRCACQCCRFPFQACNGCHPVFKPEFWIYQFPARTDNRQQHHAPQKKSG